jgi:hypothetical protein
VDGLLNPQTSSGFDTAVDGLLNPPTSCGFDTAVNGLLNPQTFDREGGAVATPPTT